MFSCLFALFLVLPCVGFVEIMNDRGKAERPQLREAFALFCFFSSLLRSLAIMIRMLRLASPFDFLRFSFRCRLNGKRPASVALVVVVVIHTKWRGARARTVRLFPCCVGSCVTPVPRCCCPVAECMLWSLRRGASRTPVYK